MNSDRLRLIVALCMPLAVATAGPGQSSGIESATSQEEYLGPRLPVHLPSPVAAADVQAYSAILVLSVPQRQAVASWHEEYQNQAQSILDEYLDDCEAISVEGGKAQFVSDFRATAAYQTGLAKVVGEISDRCRVIDEDFLGKIASILSDSQAPLLERVRMRRLRDRSPVDAAYCRGAKSDLSKTIANLFGPEAEKARVAPSLEQYEAALTPLVVRLSEELTTSNIRFTMATANFVDAGANSSAAKDGLVESALKEREAALRTSANLQRQIADLNDRTVLLLARSMEPEQGNQLLRTYRGLFPEVYPDPIEPSKIIEKVRVTMPMSDVDRQALEFEVKAFRESWESLSLRMQAAVNDWEEEFAATFTNSGDAKYIETMRSLRSQRWKLDIALVESVLARIPAERAEQRAALKDFLTNARAVVASAESEPNYPMHIPRNMNAPADTGGSR